LFIPNLLIQVHVYRDALEEHRANELQTNLEIARTAAKALEAFVQDVIHQELAIGLAITSSQPMTCEDISRLLEKSHQGNTIVNDFSWLNPEGVFIYSSNPALIGANNSDRAYFRDIAGGREWTVGELVLARTTGKPVFGISRGIRDYKGALLGLVVATVLPEKLDAVLSVKRAKGGAISIVDNKGMLVYRYPAVSLTWEERNRLSRFPTWKDALDGKEITATVLESYEGKSRVVANVPIASIGWAVGAGRSEEDAMETITSSRVPQAILFASVTLIALCTALVLSRFISTPVKRLRDHALALGSGERLSPVEATGPAELRELANSYNIMAEELRSRENELMKARDELEVRVQERTAEIQAYMEKLEESNRALQEFAYIASHDLQEPLRTISSFVQLIERRYRGKLDADADEFITFVVKGVERMHMLINDLLAYSRVDTQGKPPEPADLEVIYEETFSDLKLAIDDTDALITHDPLPLIEADPTQIRQLFQNLISNAIKFRGDAPLHVHISAKRTGDEWVFSIQDNGIGIDEEFHGRIFQVFQRLHTNDKYPGTGVGLAICRKIVLRHGGKIWIESQLGKGSCFFFLLRAVQE
jgi:signal transduction histidine kinase